jgi:MFS family permease
VTDRAATAAPGISPRQVTAAVICNGLEFYDFTIYAAFSVQIGDAFFPGNSDFIKLILSLATFGAGFALRPLGAVMIGAFADRVGRKPAMLFSLTLMGVAILGLALTPPFARIGVAAPILALVWRLAQGFALGGEVGPTTAFLVEASPPEKRGLYGSWQNVSQNMAFIAGGLVGVILAHLFGAKELAGWGWRAAMLLGAAVLPFGFWLRRDLPETLHHDEPPSSIHPVHPTLRGHTRVLVLGVALVASATVSTYVFSFMTTYALTTLHMGAEVSLAATMVNGVAGVVCGLAGGLLADRYGRRAMLIWPRLVFLVAVWPAFALMVRWHDAWSLLGATAVLSGLSALTTAALLVGLTESLRKEVRGAAMGTVYAGAVALFGGTTQPAIAALIHYTGDALAPAWYVIAFTLVGLIASLLVRESAHRHLMLNGET